MRSQLFFRKYCIYTTQHTSKSYSSRPKQSSQSILHWRLHWKVRTRQKNVDDHQKHDSHQTTCFRRPQTSNVRHEIHGTWTIATTANMRQSSSEMHLDATFNQFACLYRQKHEHNATENRNERTRWFIQHVPEQWATRSREHAQAIWCNIQLQRAKK